MGLIYQRLLRSMLQQVIVDNQMDRRHGVIIIDISCFIIRYKELTNVCLAQYIYTFIKQFLYTYKNVMASSILLHFVFDGYNNLRKYKRCHKVTARIQENNHFIQKLLEIEFKNYSVTFDLDYNGEADVKISTYISRFINKNLDFRRHNVTIISIDSDMAIVGAFNQISTISIYWYDLLDGKLYDLKSLNSTMALAFLWSGCDYIKNPINDLDTVDRLLFLYHKEKNEKNIKKVHKIAKLYGFRIGMTN